MVTCPSPASATSAPFLTSSTVVLRTRFFSLCIFFDETIGTSFNVSQGRFQRSSDAVLSTWVMIAEEGSVPDGMIQTRPRIGITMRIEQTTNRFYLGRDYSEAVEAAGGLPIHISLIPKAEYIDALVAQLDGILLPGSDSDVDPLRYGQQPHPQLGTVQTIKDETDLLVIAAAERRRIPIFAICFGMQILNVSRGGTLIQDINSVSS